MAVKFQFQSLASSKSNNSNCKFNIIKFLELKQQKLIFRLGLKHENIKLKL